jgi:bifunctional diaminopimelate decarboxylase / aspartate kinase
LTTSCKHWIVLKFGGTSVASQANWHNIAGVIQQRLAEGASILVVHSALSGVTDLLEKLLQATDPKIVTDLLTDLKSSHERLASELSVVLDEPWQQEFRHLEQLLVPQHGVAVSDAWRAQVLAKGELLATRLGAQYLQSVGVAARWLDARTLLFSQQRAAASARASVLAATCDFTLDPAWARDLAAQSAVILTQGFIAGDESGGTVLLGRGGSDTSAAYFAAKLGAQRLEIWTDVPGMFSANPRAIPEARLLRNLHYDEAQEIASNGAKVLHPRCILPVRQYRIPLHVHATQTPHLQGTVVQDTDDQGVAQVKAICLKKDVTLIAMDSPGMWHEVGFLADAFQVFKTHGLSVDLISTSETNVTVSLDPAANTLDPQVLQALVADLQQLCRVAVIGPCAAVSVVGRNIRAILPQLSAALQIFAEHKVYLLTQAANDLNFTFVVDQDQGEYLVSQLHELLIRPTARDAVLGSSWLEITAGPQQHSQQLQTAWWHEEQAALLRCLGERQCAYVYHLASIEAAARALLNLRAVKRVLYAMKANSNPQILQRLESLGVDFECVSAGEIARVLQACPKIAPQRVHCTPNFAAREEYAWAFAQGVSVTVDNHYVLAAWPEVFKNRDIFVRIDTGAGRGHHQHVRTAGTYSKFGIPVEEFPAVVQEVAKLSARIVGLHAHNGSGVFDINNWLDTARLLTDLARTIPTVHVVDLGGGFGVPAQLGHSEVDLAALDDGLLRLRDPGLKLETWIEPGRYLVAQAGVLLARVTQLKSKAGVQYVGVATGMNSLLRPALYDAHHEVLNLTRLTDTADQVMTVVGPICESADVLARERALPAATQEGDVLLFSTAGAYGFAMSSHYNLREPAEELIL